MSNTVNYDWNEVIQKGLVSKPVADTKEDAIDTKLYNFVNSYLNEKQYGIQTAHAVARLMHYNKSEIVNDYMRGSQTLIMLNGGGATKMYKLLIDLSDLTHTEWDINWFCDPEVNNNKPTAITIIPSQCMQSFINRARARKADSFYVKNKRLYSGDGSLIVDGGMLRKMDVELIKMIAEGRTV